jgi:hypothetical protein
LSGTVQAAILEVSYEGTVVSSTLDGVGYSIGDSISGSLFIDTDLAPSDRSSSPIYGSYYYSDYGSDFVTGYTPAGWQSQDQVHIENGSSLGRDRFLAMDFAVNEYNNGAGNSGSSWTYFSIDAWDYDLDFINGDVLEQAFDLSANDAVDGFYAHIGLESSVYEDFQEVSYAYGFAQINLSRLTVGNVSVPEPSALILFSAGLAGLGFTRKLKKN